MADAPHPTTPGSSDPRSALRALIERGAGTSVAATMLRLLLLRQEHPDATIGTEALRVENDLVVIRATIALPTGATGSGISAEHIADAREWAAAVERTETHAIARALDTLGYALEATTSQAPADLPRVAAPAPERVEQDEAPSEVPEEEADLAPEPPQGRVTPLPTSPRPQRPPEAETPPVIDALRRANRRPSPTGTPGLTTVPAPDADVEEAPLEDYSWTAFWKRAKELGMDRAAVEARIGRPIQGLSPLELRQALERTGLDFHSASDG